MVCAGQNCQARAPNSILVVLFIGVLGAAAATSATAAVTEEKSLLNLAAVLEEAQEILSGAEQKPSPLTNAWGLFSEFNYLHPADAVLNIAYPSSICSYFATAVPAGENYTFTGTFFNQSGIQQAKSHEPLRLGEHLLDRSHSLLRFSGSTWQILCSNAP